MKINLSQYVIVFVFFSSLNSESEFEKFQREDREKLENIKNNQVIDLNELKKLEGLKLEDISLDYQSYEQSEREKLESFKKKVEKQWDEFKGSSNKVYVEYDKNLSSRFSVDFENGEVEVEVVIQDSEKATKADVNQKIKNSLEKAVDKDAPDGEKMLKDQIDFKGRSLNIKNRSQFIDSFVENDKISKKTIKIKDGSATKYSVKFKLLPNHAKVRAERYRKEVLKQSKRFKVEPEIVFAVMQAESNFNPNARSHIPAYGLMQLVPKSGARDAYLYVYKKDRLVGSRYLYNPQNNIELGCAYLSKLKYVYFKGVKNEKSLYHCIVSAYNTGAGNVARAFTGKTKLGPAIEKINSMNSGQVYQHLLKKLPYNETKQYLKKVTKYANNYSI